MAFSPLVNNHRDEIDIPNMNQTIPHNLRTGEIVQR